MKSSEILIAAKQKIQKRKNWNGLAWAMVPVFDWFPNGPKYPLSVKDCHNPKAVSWCALGALRSVTGFSSYNSTPDKYLDYHKADVYLEKASYELHKVTIIIASLFFFGHRKVLAAYDLAIRNAQKDEQ